MDLVTYLMLQGIHSRMKVFVVLSSPLQTTARDPMHVQSIYWQYQLFFAMRNHTEGVHEWPDVRAIHLQVLVRWRQHWRK